MDLGESSSGEELMKAYQNGASRAFDLLYQRHSGRVYGFLISRLKNRAQADDIFQASFLKLHQARHHYNPSFPFLPWLFTVCKSVMLDALRKEKTNREDLIENDYIVPALESVSQRVDLDILKGLQKTAVELRYQEGFSFEEIAVKLETTPSNIRQIISRGIRKLKSTKGTSGGTNEN